MEVSKYHLIQLLKNNNKEAYKFIFRTYYLELYYLALKYTHQSEDAKDLTQSTFIKLWENRLRLLDDRTIRPFLFTIHKNNCLDYLKHKNTQKQNLEVNLSIESDLETPFDQIVSKELEFKIIEAISELPPRCRQIFEFSRFKGLKYVEIAAKLNISIKTVETQLSIALEKLRAKLIEYLPIMLFLMFTQK